MQCVLSYIGPPVNTRKLLEQNCATRHTIFDDPHVHSPERGKGDGLWPFVSPFSLLLSEDEELGLDEEALFEKGLVLQSVWRKNNVW